MTNKIFLVYKEENNEYVKAMLAFRFELQLITRKESIRKLNKPNRVKLSAGARPRIKMKSNGN